MADQPQYRLTSACYLRMRGGGPDPIHLEEGTIVGPGTMWDFEGPVNHAMAAMNPAAQAEIDAFENKRPDVPTELKASTAPSEEGAMPFDAAKSSKDSTAEKDQAAAKAAADKRGEELDAKAADLARREAAIKEREDATSAASSSKTSGPTGATGGTGATGPVKK